jgi:hypothetical protein
MAKYTKKWDKEFTKRYSNTLKELQSLEKEYKQMILDNPDTWISIYPDESSVTFGKCEGHYATHNKEGENEINPNEHVNITLNSDLGMFSFDFNTFDEIKQFRNEVIDAVDKFNRPLKQTKVVIDSDCDEDLDEDTEETEWEIKAEQPLTQSWTYTVMARSACEAIKKIENDEDGVTNNDDNEYYDYGEIEYEAI